MRNPFYHIVEKAFSHWMAMHEIERIGGSFYYYIPILFVYESPILLFGTAGIVHFLKKKDKNAPFFLFLCYWAVASLLLYSYLQEKVPWLVVHIVLPFGILAGAYMGELFPGVPDRQQESLPRAEDMSSGTDKKPALEIKRSRTNTLLAGILALTLIISLVQCISVNFYRSMEPDELMVYAQASPNIRELMEKNGEFNNGPETLRIYVVDPDNLYWPLPWYLRDYEKVVYAIKPPAKEEYDAIIVPAAYQMYREIPEREYASYNFTLRPGKEFTLYYNKKLEEKG